MILGSFVEEYDGGPTLGQGLTNSVLANQYQTETPEGITPIRGADNSTPGYMDEYDLRARSLSQSQSPTHMRDMSQSQSPTHMRNMSQHG